MKKQSNNKSSRRFGVKTMILSIATMPMLLACVIITFFASWTLENGMKSQALIGLKSTATGALLSLDNISKESFHLVNNELYKGNFNVSQNMDGLDHYAKSNNVEITFFYGNQRKATTIKDKSGKRIVDTAASSEVTSAVLKQGKEYSSANVVVNGEHFYGYYVPVSDNDGNIIGMVFAGRAKASVVSYILSKVNFIVVLAVVIYVLCVIISVIVSNKRFLKPINKLTLVAGELAKGNINQEIERETNDEFGDLTDSFMALMHNIKDQAHAAEKMASGDLRSSYRPASSQDVMGHAIQKMIHDNNTNLTVINQASERMLTGVNEVAKASNLLAQGAAQQADAVAQITDSIEGIAKQAKVNAGNAAHANDLVKTARNEAINSNNQMSHMMSAMQDISDSSENISKIMHIIDDIASQTNIISLNASVEAARAGIHGKGFAVVAEEVRKLASKSAQAAKNSADLIEDAIKKTATGSELAVETASSLEEIMNSMENIASFVSEITEASENQSESVGHIKDGITQITEVLQTTSATSQECAATSDKLSSLAEQLKDAVNKYKLQKDES